MSTTVIYDANVLYPSSTRDLLIRIAIRGLVRARWTNQILDETFRAILRRQPELEGRLERTRNLMNDAIPDVLVRDYEHIIQGINLPDVDDRHVLAAAIASGASVIVTENLKDFPQLELKPHGIVAQQADNFLANVVSEHHDIVVEVIKEMAQAKKRPPMNFRDVVEQLHRNGLHHTAAKLSS
jgi:predicted nucleic acid-binding protein